MRSGFAAFEVWSECEEYGVEVGVMLIPRERERKLVELHLHDGQENPVIKLTVTQLKELHEATSALLEWTRG